jgi:uncharacterized repeat protein (TIGR03803 family)
LSGENQEEAVAGKNRNFVCVRLVAAVLAIVAASAGKAAGQVFTVVNNFSGANGARPVAGLVLDNAGNLYGTTSMGGSGHGTVFELSPASGGAYTETVLYTFGSSKGDGSGPAGTLVRDDAGNLYGTTEHGGIYNGGTVFELMPGGGGGWIGSVLHSFGNGTDGSDPKNGLVIDTAGNLYGTTYHGGTKKACAYAGATYSCGTAFELSPVTGGGWAYSVLYNFGQGSSDGYFPWSSLTLDAAGNLYGECVYGSVYGKGGLYELSPGAGGTWAERQLHPWGNKDDGTYPYGGMVFDTQGNMYGTSSGGGGHGGLGTVFEFTPSGKGWLEHNLHGFGTALDGQFPESNLIIDAAGNLYGVTVNGGTYGYGMVYEITYSPINGYLETVLHNFTGGTDGGTLSGPLVMDSNGDLFGTTWYGGSTTSCIAGPIPGCGVAFKISLSNSKVRR